MGVLRPMVRAMERLQNQPPLSTLYRLEDYSELTHRLLSTFVQLGPDEDATAFVEECGNVSICRIMYARFLRVFYRFSDAIAMAGMNRMHVLSTPQTRMILEKAGLNLSASRNLHLLDVGAGEGRVTTLLAPLFASVTCTEVSEKLVSCLSSKGFRAILTDDASVDTVPPPPSSSSSSSSSKEPKTTTANNGYDVVALLNVLDRCSRPATILRKLAPLVKDHSGVLLIAVVLPFRPSVESSTGNWVRPKEKLHRELLGEDEFEASVAILDEKVLDPLGWQVVAWTRVPYLSYSNNYFEEYAVLDDAVLVCRKKGELMSKVDALFAADDDVAAPDTKNKSKSKKRNTRRSENADD